LRQRRDLVAGHHLGVREVVEQLSAIERADLRQGEIVHKLSDVQVLRVGSECGCGVGAFVGLDRRVVPDQGLAVLGDDDVQFQCADPEFQRFRERPQRFFGRLAAPTAMRLEVESRELGIGWR